MKGKGIGLNRVPHGGEVNVTTWGFDTIDAFSELITRTIAAAVNEAIGYAVGGEAYIFFPWEWAAPYLKDGDKGEYQDGLGGPLPADPMTIYVRLPLDAGNGAEEPTWSFSLRSVVEDMLEDGPHEGILAIRDGLLELAQKITDAANAPDE